MRPLGEVKINEPCDFEINLKEFDGSPLAADEVALSHTEKIHLLAVDPSLDDYQHLHPVPDSIFDGVWRFTITPRHFGQYRVFLDLIPIRSPRRVLLSDTFEVSGGEPIIANKTTSLSHIIGNRKFELEVRKSESDGDEFIFKFKARDSNRRPLTLRPVMGHMHTWSHLTGKERGLLIFIHWRRKGLSVLYPNPHQKILNFHLTQVAYQVVAFGHKFYLKMMNLKHSYHLALI